jgi:hypothetical protein
MELERPILVFHKKWGKLLPMQIQDQNGGQTTFKEAISFGRETLAGYRGSVVALAYSYKWAKPAE